MPTMYRVNYQKVFFCVLLLISLSPMEYERPSLFELVYADEREDVQLETNQFVEKLPHNPYLQELKRQLEKYSEEFRQLHQHVGRCSTKSCVKSNLKQVLDLSKSYDQDKRIIKTLEKYFIWTKNELPNYCKSQNISSADCQVLKRDGIQNMMKEYWWPKAHFRKTLFSDIFSKNWNGNGVRNLCEYKKNPLNPQRKKKRTRITISNPWGTCFPVRLTISWDMLDQVKSLDRRTNISKAHNILLEEYSAMVWVIFDPNFEPGEKVLDLVIRGELGWNFQQAKFRLESVSFSFPASIEKSEFLFLSNTETFEIKTDDINDFVLLPIRQNNSTTNSMGKFDPNYFIGFRIRHSPQNPSFTTVDLAPTEIYPRMKEITWRELSEKYERQNFEVATSKIPFSDTALRRGRMMGEDILSPRDVEILLNGGSLNKIFEYRNEGKSIFKKKHRKLHSPRKNHLEGEASQQIVEAQVILGINSKNDCNNPTIKILHPSDGKKVLFDEESPGVLSLELEAEVMPARLASRIQWNVPEIVGSQTTMLPTDGRGAKIFVFYEGLPKENKQFGVKEVTAEIKECHVSDTKKIQVHFPREAKNNPEAKTPNWFYYWNQVKVLEKFQKPKYKGRDGGCKVSKAFGFTTLGYHVVGEPNYNICDLSLVDFKQKSFEFIGSAQTKPWLASDFEEYLVKLRNELEKTKKIPMTKKGVPDMLGLMQKYINISKKPMEGIDVFGTTFFHELTHLRHCNKWWDIQVILAFDCLALPQNPKEPKNSEMLDADGDRIPDFVEREIGFINGSSGLSWKHPFWDLAISKGTAIDHIPDWDDEHILAYLAESMWKEGSADKEDWAYPGKQWKD
jgi:hypothetical protein